MALASSSIGTLELIITGRWSFRWPYSLVVFSLSIRLCWLSSGSIVEFDAMWIVDSFSPVTSVWVFEKLFWAFDNLFTWWIPLRAGTKVRVQSTVSLTDTSTQVADNIRHVTGANDSCRAPASMLVWHIAVTCWVSQWLLSLATMGQSNSDLQHWCTVRDWCYRGPASKAPNHGTTG